MSYFTRGVINILYIHMKTLIMNFEIKCSYAKAYFM